MLDKYKALQKRLTDVCLEDNLADVLIDTIFNDPMYSVYEATRSLISLVVNCKTDEEFKAINNTCIAILGWRLETLITDAEETEGEKS